jgi:hypothetical protein
MTKASLAREQREKSVLLHPVYVCLPHPPLQFTVVSDVEMQSVSQQDVSHCESLPWQSLLDH